MCILAGCHVERTVWEPRGEVTGWGPEASSQQHNEGHILEAAPPTLAKPSVPTATLTSRLQDLARRWGSTTYLSVRWNAGSFSLLSFGAICYAAITGTSCNANAREQTWCLPLILSCSCVVTAGHGGTSPGAGDAYSSSHVVRPLAGCASWGRYSHSQSICCLVFKMETWIFQPSAWLWAADLTMELYCYYSIFCCHDGLLTSKHRDLLPSHPIPIQSCFHQTPGLWYQLFCCYLNLGVMCAKSLQSCPTLQPCGL